MQMPKRGLCSLYCIAMGCYGLFYCIRIGRWPSVYGELHQKEVDRLSPSMVVSDQNYMAAVSYLFNVDEKEYKGHRLSPFFMVVSHNLRFILRLQMKHIEINSAGNVRVYYNPRRPHKSYLIPPGIIGYSFIFGFMLIPLLLYFIY